MKTKRLRNEEHDKIYYELLSELYKERNKQLQDSVDRSLKGWDKALIGWCITNLIFIIFILINVLT